MLLTAMMVLGIIYARNLNQVRAQVQGDAAMLRIGLQAGGADFWQEAMHALHNSHRVTIVSANGAVVYDNQADSDKMENHQDRIEIRQVLNGASSGQAIRRSATLGQSTLYYAVPLQDGRVLRLAVQTKSILGEINSLLKWLICMGLVVLLFSVFIAHRMARTVIDPLEKLDLMHPLETKAYEELTPLLVRIEHQNQSIAEQMKELSAKQEEFQALSEYMNEGLLLLDNEAAILSINRGALQILGGSLEQNYVGRHLLQLTRQFELQKMIEQALQGENSTIVQSFHERQYQIFANPIHVNGSQRGALLLFLDVTEQQQAEQMRREFSANVSHELKTPLTSISGYAEMMASGMVRQEDIQGFASRVYQEAQRLLALIQDIIRLSGLDEGGSKLNKQNVDLYAVTQQTMNRLGLQAQKHEIALKAEGVSAWISAVPSMIQELVYNLVENAVKYNRDGGMVTIRTEPSENQIVLTVEDTGIGIATSDQEHIFERFYRVDKSRSKETGGTGLGLSIVKHIAQLHGARIDLLSEAGKGTKITVYFPAIATEEI